MKIAFSKAAAPAGAALIVPVFEDGDPTGAQVQLDKTTSGALAKAAKAAKFDGKKGQTLELIGLAGAETTR
ncbi:MAG: leucyl aminopeptidase, partial [Parvularculaceae bacterium]|nr:leucyl aminopeptidase [Parvularculaceae bacterium]